MPRTFPLPVGDIGQRILRLLAATIATSILLLPATASAQRNRVSRIPVNGFAGTQSVSADGRFLLYMSDDPALTGGAPGVSEIFIRDRSNDTLDAMGLADTGAWSYAGSQAISDDGRYVVFISAASTLTANDTNQVSDVFLFDRDTRQYQRVNVGPTGQQSMASAQEVSISGDGRYVAFAATPDFLGLVGHTSRCSCTIGSPNSSLC